MIIDLDHRAWDDAFHFSDTDNARLGAGLIIKVDIAKETWLDCLLVKLVISGAFYRQPLGCSIVIV